MPRRHRAVVIGGAVLPLSVAACSPGPGSAEPSGPSGPEPGIEHVHGLGVDPADGVLHAATHFGLWRIPDEGPATRVADRLQDTMGFTVVGPGTFLGSGHPDSGKDPDLPARLGLIRSEDAGTTWESVSLGGQADFHVLHAVHGQIYGWEAGSGQVMVSGDDGATWEVRGTVDLRDLAVSPAAPDTVLATTGAGLLRSTDGGRTWEPVAGAPLLVVLAWGGPDSLYGVGPARRVAPAPHRGPRRPARRAAARARGRRAHGGRLPVRARRPCHRPPQRRLDRAAVHRRHPAAPGAGLSALPPSRRRLRRAVAAVVRLARDTGPVTSRQPR